MTPRRGKKAAKTMRSNGPLAAVAGAVRRRRKVLRLTQFDVARLARCGPVFLYDLERGKPTLRLDKLVAVLSVLGLELELKSGKRGLAVEPALVSPEMSSL